MSGRSSGRSTTPATLSAFVDWLKLAPSSTTVNASDLLAVLGPLAEQANAVEIPPASTSDASPSWRERLWTVPAETRLGVAETAEAFDRPVSFVYRHTSAKASGTDRLPHRRLDGSLVFVAGELRTWIREHEEVIARGKSEAPTLTLAPRRAS